MKRFVLVAVLLAVALCAGPRLSAQTIPGVGDRGVYTTKLANGLEVIVVEDHAAPVVQVSTWYRFGSLYETPGKTGLAHALEHMMFRGTSDVSAGGLDDIVARLGAQMNGQTDYDYTEFYFTMPADKVQVALLLEADRMTHALISQSGWNVERLAVLNELDGDASSPFYDLLSKVRAAAYPGLAAGRTPAGLRADVAAAKASDIRKYYDEWYAPNNAALVVAGDVKHTQIFALARRDFGSIPPKKLPPHVSVHPRASGGKTVEASFPFPFEVLDLAYAIPGDTEPGEPAVSTLATLIGDDLGPFYQSLVETNVALGIEAQADTQLRGGLMNVFIVLNPGHTGKEAQTIFQATMNDVLKNGYSPALVNSAKNETIAQRDYSADSIGGYGDLVGYTYAIVGEKVADEDARLERLTSQDLLAATREYLATPTVVGHLTPNDHPSHNASQKSSAAAVDNFSSRTPTGPIVYPARIKRLVDAPTTARSTLDPAEFTLPNGLRVLVQRKADRPTVYISGSIAGSPSFVPPGKEGLPRLASTLADFGSAQYDFTRLREVTDAIGASVELGQSFSAHGYARNFGQLLQILADGEEHPTFPEKWLTLQRSQLANSIDTENSISGVVIDRAYARALLAADDPALRYATPASVNSITRDNLLAYTQEYWRPDLTSVAVVGDVTPGQVRREMTAAFGSWQNQGPKPTVTQPALPPARGGHDWVGTDANQVFVQLGQPAIARSSSDYYAFNLMNEILGGAGYFESRLWQELRQRRGLVYNVSSQLKADRDRGDLEITLSCPPDKVVAAMILVREQLRKLQTQPVTQTELNEARTRIVSGALLDEASASGQVAQLLEIGTYGLPTDYFTTLNARYASITPSDIQRVAREYLRPDKLIQIYAGPEGPWSERSL